MSDDTKVERLAADLRAAWQQGERRFVESYATHDALAVRENVEQFLDFIYHEILIREEFGDAVRLDEYLARFPALGPRLRRLFEIHQAIDENSAPLALPGAPPIGRAGRAMGGVDGRGPLDREDVLPGYCLLEEIGRGGMAVVYRARQEPLGRIVALKRLMASGVLSGELLQRFEQEAQVIALLQHPNIVQIFAIGEHAERPYLALEYVSGGTLQRHLAGRPLPPASAAHLAATLSRAIAYAHQHGVVHRDLKPANILLQPLDQAAHDRAHAEQLHSPTNGLSGSTNPVLETAAVGIDISGFRPKIADFGLARLVHAGLDLTISGRVMGTPSYMAPEQADGGRDVGPAADIYSLGAILYELLTGRPPFQGATTLEILDQVRSREPVAPRRLRPGTPRDLETICLKCLDKNPARRYASAAQLADDLDRFLTHRPILARPAPFWETGLKWARRRPAVAALGALLATMSVVGVTGIAWEAHRANDHAELATHQRDHAQQLHRIAVEQSLLAQKQQQEAEAAKQAAEQAREQAEAERAAALAAQEQAEANFQRAFELVNGLGEIGARMRATPHQENAGRMLLEKALQFYQGFLHERSEDVKVQRTAAAAYVRAGTIRDSLGERGRALEAYDQALRVYEDLRKQQGPIPRLVRDTARAHWHLANTYRNMNRLREAEREYRQSIELYKEVRGRGWQETELATDIANGLTNLCVVLRDQKRFDEAQEGYREAAELLRSVTALPNPARRERLELAVCLDDHGRLLLGQEQPVEAEPLFQESSQLLKTLATDDPNDGETTKYVLRNQRSLALCQADHGEFSVALDNMRLGMKSLLESVEQSARDLNFQSEAMNGYDEWISILVRAKDLSGLRQVVHEARTQSAQWARDYPAERDLIKSNARRWILWGNELYSAGDTVSARDNYRSAVESLVAAAENWPNDPEFPHLAARIFVNCRDVEFRDYPRGIQFADQALGLAPTNRTYINTAALARRRKLQQDSSQFLQRFVEPDPKDR